MVCYGSLHCGGGGAAAASEDVHGIVHGVQGGCGGDSDGNLHVCVCVCVCVCLHQWKCICIISKCVILFVIRSSAMRQGLMLLPAVVPFYALADVDHIIFDSRELISSIRRGIQDHEYTEPVPSEFSLAPGGVPALSGRGTLPVEGLDANASVQLPSTARGTSPLTQLETSEDAVSALVNALADRESIVRAEAAAAVGGTEAVLFFFFVVALSVPPSIVGTHSPFLRRGFILHHCGTPVPCVSQHAAFCSFFISTPVIGLSAGVATLPALLESLQDRDASVREATVVTLGKLGPEVTKDALQLVIPLIKVVCSCPRLVSVCAGASLYVCVPWRWAPFLLCQSLCPSFMTLGGMYDSGVCAG